MRPRVATVAAVLVALAAPAAAQAHGPAGVEMRSCKTGSKPSERSGTYRAWMRAVDDSDRMAMHFELIAERPGQSPEHIASGSLREWHRSRHGVTRYRYKQTVKGLQQGTSYRMRVHFRWYDADGHVIKRAKRTSGACTGGPLPNLKVVALSSSPSSNGEQHYTVTVQNTGDGDAEDFKVALVIDGALVDSRTLDRVRAGGSKSVDFTGPRCAHRYRAVADRGDDLVESREDDNSLRADCY